MQRRLAVVLAILVAVLLTAALCVVVLRPGDAEDGAATGGGSGGDGPVVPTVDPAAEVPVPGGTSGLAARRSAGRGEVADRPWPARVAAPGPWSATMAGRGDRLAFSVPGTVVGGTGRASVDLRAVDPRTPAGEGPGNNRFLLLPDRARWYPLGRIRFEGPGDVAFTSASAKGRKVSVVVPSFRSVVGSAPGVVAVGSFVRADGTEVDRLALPPGTTLGEECRAPPGIGPGTCPEPSATLAVEVDAAPGVVIRAEGDGEAAVAGTVRLGALGRTWDGLVGAIEAQQVRSSAVYADDLWTMTAEGKAARQVWVDVWPVIDTQLSARSVVKKPGFGDAGFGLRIEWTNVGFATSQIFEAEGSGPGAPSVGFDLNKTQGHDAGLGVARGDRVVNLDGGGDIDSNLAPGGRVERGLSSSPGAAATIVLRGNFPDVRVPLAVPAA